MSQPTPADRLAERLAHLPDGLRALDAALDRAEAQARRTGRPVRVALELDVGAHGVEAVELSARYERRVG